MNRAAQVMVRLVDDLLDLGRIERGELHLTFDAVDVARELRGAAARQLGRASRHQFVVRVDSALPPARADAGRMRQIVDNLVENALRYAIPGRVTLRACHQGVWVQVEVEDSGPGLPPEVAARVFEKFYRAPDARHSQSRGTGI